MNFLPYARHHVTAEDVASVVEVLTSERLTQGPRAVALERTLALTLHIPGAVAVSSGTAALHLAMLAMDVKPGDRVITTPQTFCATANAIMYCGGRPVFADVDPVTLNIDPKCVEEILDRHEIKPVGIVAMHYAGRPCDMQRLYEIAQNHNVWLVEDACHALGATYPDGSPVGSRYADLSCWSFHATKQVAAGEGGAVTAPLRIGTLDRVRILRDHGRDAIGTMQELGYNYRLDEMSAALALSQLGRLHENIDGLYAMSGFYRGILYFLEHNSKLNLPVHSNRSAWHLFRIELESREVRDRLQQHLLKAGIGTQLHYRPVYLHPYYNSQGLGCPGLCPNAEKAWECGLSLPMFASMTGSDVDRVCGEIGKFFGKGA